MVRTLSSTSRLMSSGSIPATSALSSIASCVSTTSTDGIQDWRSATSPPRARDRSRLNSSWTAVSSLNGSHLTIAILLKPPLLFFVYDFVLSLFHDLFLVTFGTGATTGRTITLSALSRFVGRFRQLMGGFLQRLHLGLDSLDVIALGSLFQGCSSILYLTLGGSIHQE